MIDALKDTFGVIIILAGVICLFSFALTLIAGKKEPSAKIAPNENYDLRGPLLTRTETVAFRQLYKALNGTAHLCPKVRIADILKVRSSRNRKLDGPAFLRISQKHVDFVVMSFTGDILFAIEVDDGSHLRADRIERDAFVDRCFESARVQIIHVKPGRLGESVELRNRIQTLRQAQEAKAA